MSEDTTHETELDRLRRENEALRRAQAQASAALRFKVSEKGALSVYGLQRWPVSLYREQWLRLLDAAPALRAFIEAHDSELSRKRAPDA